MGHLPDIGKNECKPNQANTADAKISAADLRRYEDNK